MLDGSRGVKFKRINKVFEVRTREMLLEVDKRT